MVDNMLFAALVWFKALIMWARKLHIEAINEIRNLVLT